MSEWREKESLIESKIEDCEKARDKQDVINATQSAWNHATDSRLEKISTRLTMVAAAIGALAATAAENFGKVIKAIISVLTP